jgi:hypothetical protein
MGGVGGGEFDVRKEFPLENSKLCPSWFAPFIVTASSHWFLSPEL